MYTQNDHVCNQTKDIHGPTGNGTTYTTQDSKAINGVVIKRLKVWAGDAYIQGIQVQWTDSNTYSTSFGQQKGKATEFLIDYNS